MDKNYQVIARKYRPQTFQDVVGQDAIVTLLKNSIKHKRLAHAYLFSGPRGTGKTTLARLLAKAINCAHLSQAFEPCNSCPSCQEIAQGHSLDVIEIDGASNRGIEEIRKINETVGYSTGKGLYRVYIIDEVHMLTKEAFNALLKTLEEPPATVKFFFATTEPHKVLPTIISRCQRLHLRRLSTEAMVYKMESISQSLGRQIEKEALHLIASRAEGALRDAETLLDQLFSYYEGPVNLQNAVHVFGLLPQETFFRLDRAGKAGDLKIAFEIAAEIYSEGKDLAYFIQMLTEHYRHLLMCKLAGAGSIAHEISRDAQSKFQASSELYLKEQLLSILEICLEAESQMRFATSPRIALEGLLLKILRTHSKIPLDQLVNRLVDLEKRITDAPEMPAKAALSSPQTFSVSLPLAPEIPITTDLPAVNISEALLKNEHPDSATAENRSLTASSPRHDSIMQFAAVELEGKIIKK